MFSRKPFELTESDLYGPFDLTESDIDDFSYEYERSTRDVYGYGFAKHPSFSEDGLFEHLTISMSKDELVATIDIDVLRCGGAVIESIDLSSPSSTNGDDDEVRVYYYGCDDFELPAELPDL